MLVTAIRMEAPTAIRTDIPMEVVAAATVPQQMATVAVAHTVVVLVDLAALVTRCLILGLV